ncbi:MAG TPA: tyrosine--tRNA ligase, partial [Anaerolineales bacterium]|nr:tyrosine--tRNA ligase [Anaerolineales bacterium]
DAQVNLLMQGTEYGDESLRQAMADELRQRLQDAAAEGRRLRVYCGFDPRTSDLHLGHTIPMRKMRQFQELGHEVIFVIGRFTSLIGDPSDKDRLRAQLTADTARANAETYAAQAFKILDPSRTRIEYNDTWLSKLSFGDLIPMASLFTIQQFLTRDNFRQRWEKDDPIYLHETFYSLMQGYDAFHLRADVQIGGTDQLFNIVTAARKLMEALGARPNIAIIMGILPGTDGVVRMSKSIGNHIPLNTTAEDMYGKVMSVPDAAMGSFFRLVTRWTPEEIAEIERELGAGRLHPRDVKMRLAREIVSIYHGDENVEAAEQAFRRVFQDRGTPSDLAEHSVAPMASATDVLLALGWVESRSEGRRLVDQKAVYLDDRLVTSSDAPLDLRQAGVLRAGKRRFARLVPSSDA